MPRLIWITPDRFDKKPDKSSWLEMALCLQNLGWDAQILAGGNSQEHQYSDVVNYFDVPDLPLVFRFGLLTAIAFWLSRNIKEDDVVLLNPDSLWLLPYLKRKKAHVHLDIRTLPINPAGLKGIADHLIFWKLALRWFAHRADTVSYITDRLRLAVEQDAGTTNHDFFIWQSGVDTSFFKPKQNRCPISAYESGQQSLKVIYHGSIDLRRGLAQMVEALKLIPEPTKVQLTIVGAGPDLDRLKAIVAENGVQEKVHFSGFVAYESIPSIIAEADIGMCPLPDIPEWNVSSPLKVLEYMACAKPVILTPIDAHKDVLSEQGFVVWATGFDSTALANAMTDAANRIAELAEESWQGREIVEGHYSWESHASSMDDFLRRQLVNNK